MSTENNLFLTTKEFSEILVNAIVANNYYSENEMVHPEDLAEVFATTARTIGVSLSDISRRKRIAPKKAIMEATSLRKNIGKEYSNSLDEDTSLGYSEAKYSREV